MKIKIKENEQEKEYELRYDFEARLKMSNDIDTLEKAKNNDLLSMAYFIFCCLKEYEKKFKDFLESYPALEIVRQVFANLMSVILKESVNPYNLILSENKKVKTQIKEEKELSLEERKAEEHKIIQETISHLMSMGYKYKEVLEMSMFEINLLQKSNRYQMERQGIHTNAILNIIASTNGYKGKPINIFADENEDEIKEMQEVRTLSDQLSRKRKEREETRAKEIAKEVKKEIEGVINICKEEK